MGGWVRGGCSQHMSKDPLLQNATASLPESTQATHLRLLLLLLFVLLHPLRFFLVDLRKLLLHVHLILLDGAHLRSNLSLLALDFIGPA